jgi:hypothetical protein
MRRVGAGIRWASSLLLTLTGCYTTHHIAVKPPVHEEEYNLPPEGDPRYKNPPQFPKDTLNQPKKKETNDKDMGPSSGSNGMRSPGMGGMGGMGGMR